LGANSKRDCIASFDISQRDVHRFPSILWWSYYDANTHKKRESINLKDLSLLSDLARKREDMEMSNGEMRPQLKPQMTSVDKGKPDGIIG
jgi:hypothetical protein